MSGPFDVFLSYHHADGILARRIVAALHHQGLSVFFDDQDIEAFASISERLRTGVGRSKALLALYSTSYPTRRACQFELTAAILSAQRSGAIARRVLVLNPEPSGSGHIEPAELRDAQYCKVSETCDDTLAAMAEDVKAHVSTLDGLLGDVGPTIPPRWIGMRPSAATRFVGRHTAMWKVHSALHGASLQPMTGLVGPGVGSICGLGGIGKTLLAQEYALRFGAAFPGGVFWLHAGGDPLGPTPVPAAGIEALRKNQIDALAREYDASLIDLPAAADIQTAFAQRLADTNRPFLWVVDDCPSGLTAEEVRSWFAPHPLGKTLLTTRSSAYGALATAIEPSILSDQEARALLEAHRRPASRDEDREATKLVKALGFHALALDVAGAAIAAMPDVAPFAAFRSSLASPEEDVMEFAGELADVLPTGHTPSIAGTLLGSIRLLGPDGIDFLRAAAMLASAPIPASLVVSILADADRQDERLVRLRVTRGRAEARQASLVEPTEDRTSDTVHALVSHTVRFRMGSESSDRIAHLREAAVRVVNQCRVNAGDTHQARWSLQAVTPHARHLAETAEDDPEVLSMLVWLAKLDRDDGAYATARSAQERVLSARRRTLGDEHEGTLTAMGELAFTLWAQGELSAARTLEEGVVEALRKVRGAEHPVTLIATGNLAETLRSQGDLAGAQALHEHVLAIRIRILGDKHPATLKTMGNLAATLRSQGSLTRARALDEQVLATFRRVAGEEHPDTLKAMGNLAATLRMQGDLTQSRELIEEVAEALRRVVGEDNPATLRAMGNLAVVLADEGDLTAARSLLQQVLEARRRVLGESHPDTLQARDSLVATIEAQSNLSKPQLLKRWRRRMRRDR